MSNVDIKASCPYTTVYNDRGRKATPLEDSQYETSRAHPKCEGPDGRSHDTLRLCLCVFEPPSPRSSQDVRARRSSLKHRSIQNTNNSCQPPLSPLMVLQLSRKWEYGVLSFWWLGYSEVLDWGFPVKAQSMQSTSHRPPPFSVPGH